MTICTGAGLHPHQGRRRAAKG